MKTGITLQQLAAQIEANSTAKKDYIADTRSLTVTDDLNLALKNGTEQYFTIGEVAHDGLAGFSGIPNKYYEKMQRGAPALLAANLNHWLHETHARRTVRTLRGEARAFLSDRYQRIDNDEVASVIMPVLAGVPGLRCESAQITERRMYMKFVTDRVQGEVKKGDVVQAGVMISNSEVGCGATTITPLVFRLVCLNGMALPDARVRGYHVGRRAAEGEDVYQLLSDETRRADDKAILLKSRDVVKAALDDAFFKKQIERMQELATGSRIEGDPVMAVQELGKAVGLTKDEGTSVLRHLIEGGDLTAWGMLNAVTRASQDVESYDRATALEIAGGKVLELNRNEWQRIRMAA